MRQSEQQSRAFAEIVKHYSEPLYWKIRQFVLLHEDADDVLQNTFIKAWKSFDSFRGDSSLSTWLHRIAINESLDLLRRKKENQSLDSTQAGGVVRTLMADSYFDGDEAEAQLLAAVQELPEVQQMVFNLRYFHDMSYQEISQITHTTEGALKASYHIAVKKITEKLSNKD